MSSSTELGPIELSSPGVEPNCMQMVRFRDNDTIDPDSVTVSSSNGGLVASNYNRVNTEDVTFPEDPDLGFEAETFPPGTVIYYQLQAAAVEPGNYLAYIDFTTLSGRTIRAEKAVKVGNIRSR